MIYESQYTGASITLDNGSIKFTKGHHPTGRLYPFGVCDTNSEVVQRLANGLTAEQIEQEIEAQQEFIRRNPGESGIWRKDERLAKERETYAKTDLRDAFAAFTDDKLRAMLAALDVEIPMDAPRDVLLDLMVQADAKAPAAKKKKTK